jgi:hypothetical protein
MNMTNEAKRELARTIVDTLAMHEASWNGTGYIDSFNTAAKRAGVDSDLAPLVVAMLQTGCCDFEIWANEQLK